MPIRPATSILAWSHWRRHQARTRRCHYQKRAQGVIKITVAGVLGGFSEQNLGEITIVGVNLSM